MAILNKRLTTWKDEGTILLHDVANATYVVVGNNSTSNVGTDGFVVNSLIITRAWFGAANGGYWTVDRGSNTVAVFTDTGELDFDGAAITADSTANVVLTLNGGSDGFIMLECKIKQTAE